MAVFPPPAVRETLARTARDLPASGDFRLIAREKIHLTLKFLGDLTADDLDRVVRTLERLGGRHEPFEVSTSGFGAFPSERRARILWAGIGAGADLLRTVAEDVEDTLERAGFEREGRPYIPHLTLGRAKSHHTKLGESENPVPDLHFTISSIDLVQSVPEGQGLTYQTLETYPFEKSPGTRPQNQSAHQRTRSEPGETEG